MDGMLSSLAGSWLIQNPRQVRASMKPRHTWTRTCYGAVARPRFWASRVISLPPPHGPVSARSPIGRKRGTRKSRLETNAENEASSALLARLWCHLLLRNPTNRAENLTRLLQCHHLPDCMADGAGWSYPVSAKGGPAFGGNPQTEKPVEIQEVSSFAHLLTLMTRTQVLRKGCFTPSRVSTMMPISFHPLTLQ